MTVGTSAPYHMVRAHMDTNNELIFNSDADFKEACEVGFFAVKAPDDLLELLKIGQVFAENFPKEPKYANYGQINPAEGYMLSETNQTVRFSLESDHWGDYPDAIQKMAHRMSDIAKAVLLYILRRSDIPEDLWFDATGGASHGEGSNYCNFNHYNPKDKDKPFGVAAHKDFSCITVLHATQPGLQAMIQGIWHSIMVVDGYLTINFGETLELLLPHVHASLHLVGTQDAVLRTSIALFGDNRVGPFRPHVKAATTDGMVHRFNPETSKLIDGETTVGYITRRLEELYGKK